MPKTSVAALRRALTPGTRLRITNHKRPHVSRDTVVHVNTNTIGFYTWAINDTGRIVLTRTAWPKPAQLSGDDAPGVFHISQDGKPFLTLVVIEDDHPDASNWPGNCRLIG